MTCIPCAIQTDGGWVASWRDLLEGDPDVGTQAQQIHYVQLNYVLHSSSMVCFPRLDLRGQTLGWPWTVQDVQMFEASEPLENPLILTVRPQISPDAIPLIE